jgi:hypothetical protein
MNAEGVLGLVFGLPYPPDSLQGVGLLLGHPLRCITPHWLDKLHTGYSLDENDYRDVSLLCRTFHLELPAEFAGFEHAKVKQKPNERIIRQRNRIYLTK